MLRHKTIDTTAEHYIGITKAATLRAMGEVERLYEATCKQLASDTSNDEKMVNCAASVQQPIRQLVERNKRRDA
jgi:hypothetical protein